jgi:hypothetical protein
MPSQSIVLLPATSTVGAFTSAPQKGDGYYNFGDGLHTATFTFNNFVGSVRLEASLAIAPSNSDWFTINDTTFTNPANGSNFVNFYGNFVWVRATGTLTSGSITTIRYNY